LKAKRGPAPFSFFLPCLFSASTILSVLLFAACRPHSGWHEVSLLYFDTICDLKLYGQPEECRVATEKVREVFSRTEALFSPQASDLHSPEVLELYQTAKKVYLDSGGAFDITVGVLTDLWGFSSQTYRVPKPSELRQALMMVGLEKITEHQGELIIPAGVKLDWGGIAKGWGVDKAFSALQKQGIKSGFINAGGDLRCWGQNPERRAWRIGLKHPRQPGFLGVLELADTAVATSGDYQRYFEVDGVRYHHIFDPKTGFPAQGKQSVTVIGPEAAICDALATAIFVLDDATPLLRLYPDYGAIVVNSEGALSFVGKTFPFSLIADSR